MTKPSDMAQRRAAARSADDPEYRRRREELLGAAAQVFKKKGYANASLNDMATIVGIDRASLYYYASGKEELYQEIVYKAVLANAVAIEAIWKGDKTPTEKIRDLIVTVVQSYETHYPYLYIYIQENMTSIDDSAWTKKARSLNKRVNDAVIAIAQQGLDDGTFSPRAGNAHLIAYGVLGMINWTHRWYQPGGPSSATEIGLAFSELVLGGLVRKRSRA